ncbi:MAG: NmrA family NAD(P)-binding protein [Desulfovibrionaceae bacterium]
MGRILVTGATGNVGKAALDALLAAGADVIAGVRDPKDAEALKAQGTEARVFDYADMDSMYPALEGVEQLFLLLPLHQEMRRWGAAMIHAAKDCGVQFVARSSSMGADANAHYQLGKIHGMLDADLEASGIASAVLRPSIFMQNYLLYAPQVRQGILPVPEDKGVTSFVDARDVGACAAVALLRPEEFAGSTTVITGPEALDNHQVAAILAEVTGRSVEYRPAETEEMGLMLEEAGLPEWDIHMILSVHRYARNGYTTFVTKAVPYMAGRPAKSFREFAQEFASAWK